MGNCLSTQLKENVNNNSLSKLGEIRISLKPYSGAFNENNKIIITSPVDITARASVNFVDDTGADTGSKEFLVHNNVQTRLYLPPSGGYVFIPVRYSSLIRLTVTAEMDEIASEEFKYMSEIKDLKATIGGNLSYLHFTREGLFNDCPNLVGVISNLKSKTITKVELKNTQVSGSLDTWAAALAPDRENGSTLIVKGNGIITYKVNGVDTVIPNNTNKTITFNGAGGYTIA